MLADLTSFRANINETSKRKDLIAIRLTLDFTPISDAFSVIIIPLNIIVFKPPFLSNKASVSSSIVHRHLNCFAYRLKLIINAASDHTRAISPSLKLFLKLIDTRTILVSDLKLVSLRFLQICEVDFNHDSIISVH